MEPAKLDRKRLLKASMGIGMAFSVLVFFLMDLLYSDTLNGSWRQVIAMDLKSNYHMDVTIHSPSVYLVYVLILMFLMSIGAGFGYLFFKIMEKFFSLLHSPADDAPKDGGTHEG